MHEIERAPSSPTLLPKSSSTHRGNSDRRRTSQCTREAVSRRTARRCTDRPDYDESTYRSLQRAPPRAGRTPHHGARQSRAGCPAHSSLHVRVRCQGRTGRDGAGPIAMRGGWSSGLWSGTHLEAGASHSAMATVSWKPLMRAPLSRGPKAASGMRSLGAKIRDRNSKSYDRKEEEHGIVSKVSSARRVLRRFARCVRQLNDLPRGTSPTIRHQ